MPIPLPDPLPTPCLSLPGVTLPTLPPGLTLGLALPTITFDPTLCCKLLPFPLSSDYLVSQIPPLPPLALNPAVIATLNAKIALLQVYFDQRSISCPLEPSDSGGAFSPMPIP